jgi:L-alanine-DL-glutamate epimerase-like enolase superfamily enzyme
MMIENVESWILRFPYHPGAADAPGQMVELAGVFVHTDEGTRGMGFTYSFCSAGRSIKALIDDVLAPAVVGRQLVERACLWDELWGMMRRLGAGVTLLALSALDTALWDAAARAQGMALHRLLGTHRTRIPVFGSGNYSPALTTEKLVDNARRDIDRGFDAIKVRIGGRAVEEDVERLAGVRAAIGDKVRLMTDAAELLTLAEATWVSPRLNDINIYWLEEPLPSEDLIGYRDLQARVDFPLALGEHFFTRFQFLDCLRLGAAQVLQPDVAIVGGVTEFMRIVELAKGFGRPIAPHLVTDLHVQLAAASPNTIYVEHFPFTDHLWEEGLEVREGTVLVPDRPGHGLDFRPSIFDECRVG